MLQPTPPAAQVTASQPTAGAGEPVASGTLRHLALAFMLGLGLSSPAAALYKVVQPDGSVTYTDRPPITSNARITALNRNAMPTSPEAGLPPELRRAVARYPVTLYTGVDCPPCDAARRLLQQRGIPHGERRVSTDDDAAALERLVGGRTVPALTIGAQPLRGLSELDWNNYLDAAGYPRTNRLPRGWPTAEATPLTERAPVVAAPPPAPMRPAPPPAPEPSPPPPSGGLRF